MNYALIALVVALVFVIIIIGIWLMSSTPDTIDVVPPPQLLQNGGAPVVDPLLQNGVSPVVPATEVPVVDPYTFHHMMNSMGRDIIHVTGVDNDIPTLLSICKSKPNCKGFTHHGWLKHTIRPQDQWEERSGNEKGWKTNSKAGLYVLN